VRPLWLDDIESLEAISQNEDARRILLRMAALSQTGRTPSFVVEVALDGELDATTKSRLVELAQDESFLLAVEEYLVPHSPPPLRPRYGGMGDPDLERPCIRAGGGTGG
jgi:hypothetical protein